MRKSLLALVVALVIPLALAFAPTAAANPVPPDYVAEGYYQLLTPEELEDLLAPIALYPDPLIAQILPAATFVDQIEEAARFVRRHGTSRVDYQPWDLSVRAVAHYPKLLYMLERDHGWTVALGQAFVEQRQDVMDAIQRLRDYAWAQGNLYSTPEQEVIYEADAISIVPARPRYVYIPVYDPYLVYAEPYYPNFTFSVGFTIGAWLNRDCDWRDRRVYYHGWRGSRWVNRARPHIRDRRNIYITPRASEVRVNRNVIRRDTRGFREQLRSEVVRRRQDGRLPSGVIRTERPRPGRIERPVRTERQGTERPRGVEPAAPGVQRLEQNVPARRERPAATGSKGRPARQGQTGERRRELRQINRPSPTGVPPAASQPPARVIQTPQSPAGVQTPQTPAPVIETPRTPAPGTAPPQRPTRVIQPSPAAPAAPAATPAAPQATPTPTQPVPERRRPAATVPRAAEPAAQPSRGREHQPDTGRGRSGGAPVVPRGAPGERR